MKKLISDTDHTNYNGQYDLFITSNRRKWILDDSPEWKSQVTAVISVRTIQHPPHGLMRVHLDNISYNLSIIQMKMARSLVSVNFVTLHKYPMFSTFITPSLAITGNSRTIASRCRFENTYFGSMDDRVSSDSVNVISILCCDDRK